MKTPDEPIQIPHQFVTATKLKSTGTKFAANRENRLPEAPQHDHEAEAFLTTKTSETKTSNRPVSSIPPRVRTTRNPLRTRTSAILHF
jgi:hypothetical protein